LYNDGAVWGYSISLEDYDVGSSVEIRYSMAYGFLTHLRIVLILGEVGATQFLMQVRDSTGLYAIVALGICIPAVLVIGLLWRRKQNNL
jgi:hypothetical protein